MAKALPSMNKSGGRLFYNYPQRDFARNFLFAEYPDFFKIRGRKYHPS
jgi:hypothetical protein